MPIIENEDGTKTIIRDNHVIGIYGQANGRWAGITLLGQMYWADDEDDIYDQLTERNDGSEADFSKRAGADK